MESEVKPETPWMQSPASRVNRMTEEGGDVSKFIDEVERIQKVKITDLHA